MTLSAFLLHSEKQTTMPVLLSSPLPISIQYSRSILVSSSKISTLNNSPGVCFCASQSPTHVVEDKSTELSRGSWEGVGGCFSD